MFFREENGIFAQVSELQERAIVFGRIEPDWNTFATILIDKKFATKQDPLEILHMIDGFGEVFAQVEFRSLE